MNILDIAEQAEIAVKSITLANGHLGVLMTKLRRAEVAWLNEEEARDDPMWARLRGDRDAYIKYLLDTCAYQVAPANQLSERVGVADRYGGGGIGFNGGSGRAAMVGPYYVKGIGRTPLIGVGAHPDHVTGGAYLEECVRESLLAEIMHRELPYGAVRTLAIIITGDIQVWDTEKGPKPERCCLLVRRAFLRPAHIERAALFRSNEDFAGMADAHRVRCMISALEACAGGADALREQLITCFVRWARQLGASFLQCLPHSGVSSSNVAIDGRLADFGATAGVPSLSRYWVGGGRHPSGDEVHDIISTIHGIACAFRFTAGKGESIDAWMAQARDRVLRAYSEGLRSMILYLLGFSTGEIQSLLAGEVGRVVSRRIDDWLSSLRRRVWSVIEGAPWHRDSMPSLEDLDALEAELKLIAGEAGMRSPELSSDATGERREIRSRWIIPRVRLDHDALKEECYARVDGQQLGSADASDLYELITDLISRMVEEESRTRFGPLKSCWADSPPADKYELGVWSQTWSFRFEQLGSTPGWRVQGPRQP